MPNSPQSEPPGRSRAFPFERVVDLIAPTLGREKSEEVVGSAAKFLGYSRVMLTFEHCLAILLVVGSQPGIVGVSARFARSRLLTTEKRVSSKPPARVIRAPAAPSPSPTAAQPAAAKPPAVAPAPTVQPPAVAPPAVQASLPQSPALQPPAPTARASGPRILPLAEVLDLLSHTLGSEKSREVIRSAMVELGMPEVALDISQVKALLEVTAKAEGLVGIASRFAKARLILRLERAAAG
jgi:hypothetical protein